VVVALAAHGRTGVLTHLQLPQRAAQQRGPLQRSQRFSLLDQHGLLGVLQTWTCDLRYHPHVHSLAPGGQAAD
jgi:hypothetical protein